MPKVGTILLAEDDDSDWLLLQRALKLNQTQKQIHRVKNGKEVIHYLLGKNDYSDRTLYPFPKIILTDLKMPCMGGLELLQWRKENPTFQTIPMMVLSAANDPKEVQQCYLLGANAYFLKPSDFNGLRDLADLSCRFGDACEIPRY